MLMSTCLSSEQQKTQLGKSKENYAEHEAETSDIFCTLKWTIVLKYSCTTSSKDIGHKYTLEIVLDNWVIVLLNEIYLNSLIQEKKTQMATTLLLVFDLQFRQNNWFNR